MTYVHLVNWNDSCYEACYNVLNDHFEPNYSDLDEY